MKPGRELDALIAEKVFCLSKKDEDWIDGERYIQMSDDEYLKEYSTDIWAAWKIVEKMCPEINGGFNPQFEICTNKGIEISWSAHFNDRFGNAPWGREGDENMYFGHGDTAPHAICLAALEAVGVKVKKK